MVFLYNFCMYDIPSMYLVMMGYYGLTVMCGHFFSGIQKCIS